MSEYTKSNNDRKSKEKEIARDVKDIIRIAKLVVQGLLGILILIITVIAILKNFSGLFPTKEDLFSLKWSEGIDMELRYYLKYVGYALGLSAGAELGYMLFTEGPDEAVEPIILGVASAIIIILSKDLNYTSSKVILILVFSLFILFGIKTLFIRAKVSNEDEDNSKSYVERILDLCIENIRNKNN